jgi:hypothetical protein
VLTEMLGTSRAISEQLGATGEFIAERSLAEIAELERARTEDRKPSDGNPEPVSYFPDR